MNDIEIINQVIYTEQGEKMNYIDIDNIIDNECENFIQAIENLMQRNKDLEEIEKEHKEENGRLREENEVLRYGLRENKILRHGLEENTEEIDKLYKIINLMAETIVTDHEWFYSKFDNYTKQDFIEYFTNKVEEDIKE